jgi:hypothetical protein
LRFIKISGEKTMINLERAFKSTFTPRTFYTPGQIRTGQEARAAAATRELENEILLATDDLATLNDTALDKNPDNPDLVYGTLEGRGKRLTGFAEFQNGEVKEVKLQGWQGSHHKTLEMSKQGDRTTLHSVDRIYGPCDQPGIAAEKQVTATPNGVLYQEFEYLCGHPS